MKNCLLLVLFFSVVLVGSGCSSFGSKKGRPFIPEEGYAVQNAVVSEVTGVHEEVKITGPNDCEVKRVGKIVAETRKESYNFSSEKFFVERASDTPRGFDEGIIPSIGQEIAVYLDDKGEIISVSPKPNKILKMKYPQKK